MQTEILAGLLTVAFMCTMVVAVYYAEKIKKRILKKYGRKHNATT
jgi:hypothetical protein